MNIINKFEFNLSNGEDRYLITEMNLDEIKQYIQENEWITLNHYGVIYRDNGMRFVPKVADIQTCNIVRLVEDEGYQKRIDELKESKIKRLRIINEIENYQLNILNRIQFKWKTHLLYVSELEHKLLEFGEEYLMELLEWVKKKGKRIL